MIQACAPVLRRVVGCLDNASFIAQAGDRRGVLPICTVAEIVQYPYDVPGGSEA